MLQTFEYLATLKCVYLLGHEHTVPLSEGSVGWPFVICRHYNVASVPWYMRSAAKLIYSTPPSSTHQEVSHPSLVSPLPLTHTHTHTRMHAGTHTYTHLYTHTHSPKYTCTVCTHTHQPCSRDFLLHCTALEVVALKLSLILKAIQSKYNVQQQWHISWPIASVLYS